MKHKLVIAMTAATLFLVGCGQRQHTEQVTLVRIDTVKTANTCDILEFPARVQAAGEVHLAFKIPGTLQRIYVDDGAFVRQGELVAEMDPRDYELQLQAVEAEYLSIKAEAERVMALYDQNVATADAYDKARYGLQQITAKYENARNQLADTKLYAPFDGYVKRRRFDPPTVVAAGMPVITFLSGKNPEVELFIPASTYIRRREIASFAAVFDFLQGQKIPLRLLHVDPSANANQLYAVRLALPVNTEIAATPGMNATVEVAMRQETEASVEIPASALFSNGDKTSYVWIYRQDGTIARRRVEVVRLHTDGTATIADGLNEGERIVVAGVHKLTEGQRVAPLPAPSKTNEGGLLCSTWANGLSDTASSSIFCWRYCW